jgi:serine protease Do
MRDRAEPVARGRARKLARFALIVGLVALTACQATGARQASPDGSATSYGMFSSPADHLEELLRANDLNGAAQVYASQRSWFADGDDSRRALLNELAARLDADLAPTVKTAQGRLDAVAWPAERSQWPAIKAAVESADGVMAKLRRQRILLEPAYRRAHVTRLNETLDALRQRLRADAARAFLDYPLDGAPSFLASYPIEVHLESVLADASWGARLARYDRAGLDRIAQLYGARLPHALAEELGRARRGAAGGYVAAAPATALGTDSGESAPGIASSVPSGARAVLVDLTSRTLTRQGAIEFPVAVAADGSYQAIKTDLAHAFDGPVAAEAELIVLVDVASARTDRRIAGGEEIASEAQVGVQTVPNPAYAAAVIEVNKAMLELQEQRIDNAITANQPCDSVGCTILGFGGIVAQIAVQERLDEARKKLARTATTITEPVYAPYRYTRSTIEAAKIATVHYYVIDRRSGSYLRDTFDLREAATFTVAYGLHAQDRNRAAALRGTDTEDDVAAFEAAAVEVRLAEILERFERAAAQRETLPSLEKIHAQILADQNAALAALQAQTYEVVAGDGDGRFDSVVVVYHPDGGLGSGFYVTGDLVLTNFHVIDRTRFVEIKLFNGMETTGKVIASDPRLDLALVKVQTRGQPAPFYTERTLPLGAEVELIGHPDGFEFSITRGVVSALRELESLNLPGGKKVRFIQTDAAVNGGNSGGPMFLGDRVVGVNTRKLVAVEIEGLNFAVHYGEVLEFLTRNGIAPGTGS